MDLKKIAISKVATAEIDGQVTTKQVIFIVPVGQSLVPVAIVARSPSATLAGLTDLDIGGNSPADDWLQQVSLNAFTATSDYGVIEQPAQAAGPPIVPTEKTLYAAGIVFGVKINTGSTGAATFTIDLFGYLF